MYMHICTCWSIYTVLGGGLELLKRTFLKATMIVIIIRLYFFIFRVLTKYTGQDASKATSIKNKSNSWPLGFGVTPTEKPHLPRSHSRGSKFSGHPDLRWGAIPLSAIGKKKIMAQGGGTDAEHWNQIAEIGGLVFHCFLFNNLERIQEASSKKDTYTCTAYDVPRRLLQYGVGTVRFPL